jgi:hypothetical protein
VPKFSSEENYFPVFENNTADLQTLEARVVIKITAFYTYMKAARDAGRSLSAIGAQDEDGAFPAVSSPRNTSRQEVLRNLLYMLYLAFESGRLAIEDLVEYEPERADDIITILISELEAYRFLRSQFIDEADVRHQRLMLREPQYTRLIREIHDQVNEGRSAALKRSAGDASQSVESASPWEPAWRLLTELQKRADAALVAGS